MKDYVEQQKKLQKDISDLLERNLTAVRKREQLAKDLEEQRQESERQLQEAAEDINKTVEESEVYIPPEDSIHRPKLLFIPHSSEKDLDSPVTDDIVFELPPSSQSNTLNFPPSTDILSPQYCVNPKAAAKRIFSVTRVSSPTLLPSQNDPYLSSLNAAAACCVVNSPTAVHPPVGRVGDSGSAVNLPHLCMPLPTVDIKSLDSPLPLNVDINTNNVSPNTIQKGMADQTLENYIQQIVGEQSKDSSDGNSEVKIELSETAKDTSSGITLYTKSTECADLKTDSNSGNNASAKEELNTENEDFRNTKDQQINSNCDTNAELESESGEQTEATIAKTEDKGLCSNDNNSTLTEIKESAISDNENKEDSCNDESVQSEIKEEETTESQKSMDVVESDGSSTLEVEAPTGEMIDCESDKTCDNANGDDVKHVDTGNEKGEETVEDSVNSSVDEVNKSADCSIENVEGSSPTTITNGSNCDSHSDTSVVKTESTSNDNKPDHVEPHSGETNGKNAELGIEFVECDDSGVSDNSNDRNTSNSNGNVELSKSPVDSEPWNPVNVEATECAGETVKPDFHTSLSLNGLKQELASLIDEETLMANGSVPHSKATPVPDTSNSCMYDMS